MSSWKSHIKKLWRKRRDQLLVSFSVMCTSCSVVANLCAVLKRLPKWILHSQPHSFCLSPVLPRAWEKMCSLLRSQDECWQLNYCQVLPDLAASACLCVSVCSPYMQSRWSTPRAKLIWRYMPLIELDTSHQSGKWHFTIRRQQTTENIS